MVTADLINGAFGLGGFLALVLGIRRAYLDKQVRGVSVVQILFFAVWAYWNIYYYPSLGQWWSTGASVLLAVANTVWVGQLIYYTRKETRC
jgi:uncharacterized membrane protein YfcA